MPNKAGYQRLWRCSWKCGFKHKNLTEVFEHEKNTHMAVQYARLKKKKDALKLNARNFYSPPQRRV